jgi:hypothetical protein
MPHQITPNDYPGPPDSAKTMNIFMLFKALSVWLQDHFLFYNLYFRPEHPLIRGIDLLVVAQMGRLFQSVA